MPHHIYTPDEVLYDGLLMTGYDYHRQQKVSRQGRIDRFVSQFGSVPVVYSEMANDLQKTDVAEAKVDNFVLRNFLMGVHFLKKYPRNRDQEASFTVCLNTASKWAWFYAEKICAMKSEKVRIASEARK